MGLFDTLGTALATAGQGLRNALMPPKGAEPGQFAGDPLEVSRALELNDDPEVLATEELEAIKSLIESHKNSNKTTRLQQLKDVLEKRMYLKGRQYIYWDEDELIWKVPDPEKDKYGEKPTFRYKFNIFQGFALSLMSVGGGKPLNVEFFPRSTSNPRDVKATTAADRVVSLFEQQNAVDEMTALEWSLLFTDGTYGVYTRHKVDEDRWGKHQEQKLQMGVAQAEPNRFVCPSCGSATPEEQYSGLCPCGEPLGEEDMVFGRQMQVPVVAETIEVPNGREVMDIVGLDQLWIPSYSKDIYEFPFLFYPREVPSSMVLATFPGTRGKIGKGKQGSNDEVGRMSRLIMTESSEAEARTVETSLVTYEQCWLRTSSLLDIKDEQIRESLLQKFPDGVYISFADGEYCEHRTEQMTHFWKIAHAMPGTGQVRPSIGDSLMDLQKALNDVFAIMVEAIEYGFPFILANRRVINPRALKKGRARPGNVIPVLMGPQDDINKLLKVTDPVRVPEQTLEFMNQLAGQFSQFATGAMPAFIGADMATQETSSGYQKAINQSVGRLKIFWRAICRAHAAAAEDLVRAFKENRVDDVEMTSKGPGGFSSDWIHIEDLEGEVTARYPEASEELPLTWAEKQGAVMGLINTKNPVAVPALMDLDNVEFAAQSFGMPDLVMPGQNARKKQLAEIQELLKTPPMGGIDPMTGMPVMQPTVAVLPFDKHQYEFMTCQNWMESEEGLEAKKNNPAGFQNVMLHAQQHFMQAQAQMMQQAAQQAAAEGSPNEGPPQ